MRVKSLCLNLQNYHNIDIGYRITKCIVTLPDTVKYSQALCDYISLPIYMKCTISRSTVDARDRLWVDNNLNDKARRNHRFLNVQLVSEQFPSEEPSLSGRLQSFLALKNTNSIY